MECNRINQFIDEEISKEEFEKHTKECSYCNAMDSQLKNAFSILEFNAEVPTDMAEKIMRRKNNPSFQISLKKDIAMILQIACVLVAGIFLGIVLGKNSNTRLLMSKDSERKQSLIEYRNIHHFKVDHEFFQ